MSELMTKSLAQIVNNDHKAASVFEKYHLDFCCKGKRTLQQACAESNLNPENVITELESGSNGNQGAVTINYDKLTLAQLTEYIINTHHSYVKKELPQVLAYLQKVVFKHGDRHPEMHKVLELFSAVKEEMEQHMQKEELILFPRIKEMENLVAEGKAIRLNSTYLLAPINMMEQEHDHAGILLSEISHLTNNYDLPADACTTYRLSFAALKAFETDLHQHVHLENNILFPKAMQLFGIPDPYSLN